MSNLRSYLPVAAIVMFCATLESCKSPGYYEPPVNHPVFNNKNEAQVSGVIGLSGVTGKFGYAVTDHVAVLAMWNAPIGSQEYRAREGEFGGGLFAPARNRPNYVNAAYA